MNFERVDLKEKTKKEKTKTLDQTSFVELLHREGMTYEPSPHDTSKVSGEVKESLNSKVGDLEKVALRSVSEMFRIYLKLPIITDGFTSHVDRRTWKHEREAEYSNFTNFIERNRIRRNAFTGILPWLELLRTYCEKNVGDDPELKALQEVLSDPPDISNYDALTIEEKRSVVEKMDSLALRFLHLVTLPHA
jgi:hypothetical protein